MSETMAVYHFEEKHELSELEKEKSGLIAMADNFIVSDRESFNLASEYITTVINPFIDRVKADIGPVVKTAHNAWKKAKELMASYEDPAQEAKAILNRKKGSWELSEIRRIEEENRKKLFEDRRLEQERLKAEAEAQAIAQKAIAEAQLKRAIDLESQGKTEQAEKVINAVMPTPVVEIARTSAPVELEKPIEKTEGEKKIREFVWRLENEEDFSKIDRKFLMPDRVAISKAVKAHGKEAERIVGGIMVDEQIRYAYDRQR